MYWSLHDVQCGEAQTNYMINSHLKHWQWNNLTCSFCCRSFFSNSCCCRKAAKSPPGTKSLSWNHSKKRCTNQYCKHLYHKKKNFYFITLLHYILKNSWIQEHDKLLDLTKEHCEHGKKSDVTIINLEYRTKWTKTTTPQTYKKNSTLKSIRHIRVHKCKDVIILD